MLSGYPLRRSMLGDVSENEKQSFQEVERRKLPREPEPDLYAKSRKHAWTNRFSCSHAARRNTPTCPWSEETPSSGIPTSCPKQLNLCWILGVQEQHASRDPGLKNVNRATPTSNSSILLRSVVHCSRKAALARNYIFIRFRSSSKNECGRPHQMKNASLYFLHVCTAGESWSNVYMEHLM